ncbi:hypothetical protein SO802_003462 [Lithocarpus litseifolius]|uniref:Dynamin stalk domain-containing protein n=1 Tax=Lithocarpus litseifolius TaxID=425828 RepID=A0AAW2E3M8_9ROSI
MIIARRKEWEYFATSPEYGHLASKMGSEYLAKLLSKHLESVIRARIPSITSLINKSVEELESEMDHLGRPIAVDAGAQLYTILELCRAFDRIFKEHLEGGRPGGDRIYGVFDNQLPVASRKLPFDRHLSLQNVKKVVSEADGYQPHLIAPEQGGITYQDCAGHKGTTGLDDVQVEESSNLEMSARRKTQKDYSFVSIYVRTLVFVEAVLKSRSSQINDSIKSSFSWYFVWFYVHSCFVSMIGNMYGLEIFDLEAKYVLPLTWNSVEKIFTFQVFFSYNFKRALKNH